MPIKIVVIGAGSALFSQGVLNAIAAMPEMTGSTVALVDIDEERLDLITKWALRMVHDAKVDLKIEHSAERRDLLRGADYVMSTIDVGFKQRLKDLEICAKHGIVQGVGDTIGPVGLFKGFRVVPVLVDIAKDIEKLCPDAFFFNFSNPMAISCRCVSLTTKAKIVGLCGGIDGSAGLIAQVVGVPPEELDWIAAGVNHLSWVLKAYHKGMDVYPRLRERIEEPEIYARSPLRFELFKIYGLFPSESDMHDAEYVPFFARQERLKKFGLDEKIKNHLTNLRTRPDDYLRRMREQLGSKDPIQLRLRGGHAKETRIIKALEFGTREMVMVNMPNKNYISNLPEGVIVEVPAVTGAHDIRPVHVGDLPQGVLGLVSSIVNHQELAVQTILTGDRKIALQALLSDPVTSSMLSIEETASLLDELYAAHDAWKESYHV